MVLECTAAGAICSMGMSVVLERLKTDVLVLEVLLSGESAGAEIVMVL